MDTETLHTTVAARNLSWGLYNVDGEAAAGQGRGAARVRWTVGPLAHRRRTPIQNTW